MMPPVVEQLKIQPEGALADRAYGAPRGVALSETPSFTGSGAACLYLWESLKIPWASQWIWTLCLLQARLFGAPSFPWDSRKAICDPLVRVPVIWLSLCGSLSETRFPHLLQLAKEVPGPPRSHGCWPQGARG